MDKNDSKSSLIQLMFPFYLGLEQLNAQVGISEEEWLDLSSLPDHATFGLHLDDTDRKECERKLPEYFVRPFKELWKEGRVDSPFVETQREPYRFEVMSFSAPLSTQTLDNTPILEPYQTWLSQAFASQSNFWNDESEGVIPLDWGAFILLLRTRECGEEQFLSLIDHKYHRYTKITLVFADVIYGGRDRQRLYLIWTLKRKKEGFDCGFKICQDFAYQLAKGETFITVCIPRRFVEFPEYKKNPILFKDENRTAPIFEVSSSGGGAASFRKVLIENGVENVRQIPPTAPRP